MINYIEKYKIHESLDAAGLPISEKNGTWVSENGNSDTEVNNFISAYNPLSLAQSDAIEEISKYASDLIDSKISPLKAKRIQSDAISATVKSTRGNNLNAADVSKLDTLEISMIYPDKIFVQYDIEEDKILTETDWKLIDTEAAKANLDAIV